MTDLPTSVLLELGLLGEHAAVQVELLAGGYANDLWRVRAGRLDVVVKRFRDANVGGLYGNSHELEARALRRLAGTGIAPRLVAHLPEHAVVVYRHVPGTQWRSGAEAVAATLARLHQVTGDGFPALTTAPALLLSEGDTFADRCSPPLLRRTRAARPLPIDLAPVPLRLVHRDCGPGNVIASDGGAVLIDWQCPGLGDPVEDLCAFLSPACSVLYGQAPLASKPAVAFLDAYPDSTVRDRFRRLRPFYDYRMLGYCAWRSELLLATRPTDAASYAHAVEALLA